MSPRSAKLIELRLSGKSAEHIIDALVEALPALPAIRQSILNDLPKGSEVRIEENTVYIECADKESLAWKVPFFESMYPELDFVAKQKQER
jgi:hypothetical protein